MQRWLFQIYWRWFVFLPLGSPVHPLGNPLIFSFFLRLQNPNIFIYIYMFWKYSELWCCYDWLLSFNARPDSGEVLDSFDISEGSNMPSLCWDPPKEQGIANLVAGSDFPRWKKPEYQGLTDMTWDGVMTMETKLASACECWSFNGDARGELRFRLLQRSNFRPRAALHVLYVFCHPEIGST